MRFISITAVTVLLTNAVTAEKKPHNGYCNRANPDLTSLDNMNACATLYDPTVDYPVWDESEDFSCDMCPPEKELSKIEKKMRKHENSLAPVQGRGLLKGAFNCVDNLFTSVFLCGAACCLVPTGLVCCCPCLTIAFVKWCRKEC
ncbi:hypothetical protein LZ31DRAFT_186638 [Colletotrichum somersetense]|nr:hypothetical protein LZ31DRAFT_186638 [Colletotrichum somersetense]